MSEQRLRQQLTILGFLLLPAVLTLGAGGDEGRQSVAREITVIDGVEVRDLGDGIKTTIALGDLNHVCPLDCISSVENPVFAPVSETSTHSTERVIGISVEGEARAYPLSNFREVVNDTINGKPILITWCPLCGTPIVFERTVDGRAVEFGVSGKLHHNDLVLYDRETFTLWQQLTGEAIVGSRVPDELTMIPADLVSLRDWRERHPDTLVLEGGDATRSTGKMLPYEEKLRGSSDHGNGKPDRRLDSYAVVFGLEIDEQAKAYPEKAMRGRLVEDELAGTPLLIVGFPDTNFVQAFQAPSEKASTDGAPRYTVEGMEIHAADGRRWDAQGRALTAGADDLERLISRRSYWFAWAAFHPETRLLEDEA
ncbi:MAG: DUF3179 domain-containing protein [Spirochaetes bacterium]|nr:DUF3179 domain-containing protein [Spirochaetota bacterium]